MQVIKSDGSSAEFDATRISRQAEEVCEGLDVNRAELLANLNMQFFDGMTTAEINVALKNTAAGLISEESPEFDQVAARFVVKELKKEAGVFGANYGDFETYLRTGVEFGHLNPLVLEEGFFNLNALDDAIFDNTHRDDQFTYQGIQTVADRYLLRSPQLPGKRSRVYELPQHMFMRVAMGLSLMEAEPTVAAIATYNLLSSFDFMNSTPTLFNSCTNHSQMSSCYGTQFQDDIVDIFDGFKHCALLSKFSGGVGSDWTPVRAMGSHIKSTNGKSSGPIPYIKIYNDTAVSVDQGGKRKGAFAPYMECWHLNFPDFVDLKLQSGDEYLRARDVYPASWIPDLFMQRVRDNEMWSLFCPNDVPQLHEVWGEEFERVYLEAEANFLARKQIPAMDLWKRMLDRLTRTGAPWNTWKDESNRRNPQQHVGVVHNSNLCTEIILNNSKDEHFVCNLGSANAAKHVKHGEIDRPKLEQTVRHAVRILDNVIDLNFYPTEQARNSNMKHRPIGLGLMGYAEALVACGIDFESEEHLQWADELFEIISYSAIKASAELARERGSYESFEGSLWSQGILTIDTARDQTKSVYSEAEWEELRQFAKGGMRNCNIIALAPTATIANIVGTTEVTQPINERVLVKENLSGNFKIINPLAKYNRPDLVKTVWEVDQIWIIDAATRRAKWIDQGQSTNLYRHPDKHKGKVLSDWYFRMWEGGNKTSYYLRNMPVRSEAGSGTQQVGDTNNPPVVLKEEAEPQFHQDSGEVCESCQ